MAVAQSTYLTGIAEAVPGMVANSETDNRITRTASGNIGFGLPVQRVGDHNCILASTEVLEASAPAPNAGNTGDGTFAATPTISAPAVEGSYTVEITAAATNAGSFLVSGPGGVIGAGTVGTAFSSGGVAFTLQDGATDFVVGDGFTFDVTASVATADLDVLGISIKNIGLDHTTADRYEQYDNVAILTQGAIWVTAGATVVAGDDVFWSASTSRFTNTDSDVALPGWKFDRAAADGGLTIVTRR